MYPVSITTLPDLRVAALAHRGPYPEIPAVFARLSREIGAAGLWDKAVGPAIGLYYDSPDDTPAADLRAHAGLIVANDAVLPSGLEELQISGGALCRAATGRPLFWPARRLGLAV